MVSAAKRNERQSFPV